MIFLFWRTCELCGGVFHKKHLIKVQIGPHYPWKFCERCYRKDFPKNDK